MSKLTFFRPTSRWLLVLLWPLLHLTPAAQAQRFWLTTRDFPEGPKTGLASVGDSVLCTAVGKGILRTGNQGRSWTLALRARGVNAFYTTRAGLLLAGGRGRIYRSLDAGLSWDSVTVPSPYPVASFVETPAGGLFAGVGVLDVVDGFLGSGVFFSADNGRSWTARNNGLGAGRFVNQLAADRSGRVFLSVADDDAANQPGLYCSTDNGLSWQHQAIRIGHGFGYLTAYQVTALAVRPRQDSLMLSFTGSGGNFGVALNLTKSLTDVADGAAFWTIQPALFSSWWWDGTVLNRVHFARNGDWYSSCVGSINTGATLVSQDQGRSWRRVQYGLGLDVNGRRGPQLFAEASDGKLLMVQHLDERVYWTDASLVTATRPRAVSGPLTLYPNPATTTVRLDLPAGPAPRTLRLLDLSGRLVCSFPLPSRPEPSLTLDLSGLPAGVYVVAATLANGQLLQQRLVKQ
ncbi:T9SS type A sorting domain-containing protein [Hymenobacter jeollabukensis]|uniref:T9SS type A sorting domain-containing protein n=1 Tax=Hymenobacter jeollabukensis TaxID=2025313 RepID=A0A5R8WP49_9BACT|nr:T9SS type A sorting domain-containing protein [Hymenobacter jeollabukensis]TLM91191.1 T9SS type A sorting domain-containing protein [Hymenobacter jeollabukensis]